MHLLLLSLLHLCLLSVFLFFWKLLDLKKQPFLNTIKCQVCLWKASRCTCSPCILSFPYISKEHMARTCHCHFVEGVFGPNNRQTRGQQVIRPAEQDKYSQYTRCNEPWRKYGRDIAWARSLFHFLTTS